MYLSLVLLILSILTYVKSINLPKIPSEFPKLVAVSLFVASLALLVSSLTRRKQQVNEKEHDFRSVIILTIGLIIYTAIVKWVGHIIATIFIVIYVISVLGYQKNKTKITVAILSTLLIFSVFKMILGVPLPLGFLTF